MSERRDRKLDDLPEGTMLLRDFAKLCNIRPGVVKNHVSPGIRRRSIGSRFILETTKVPAGANRVYYYVTPDQQRKALEFWDRHGVSHRKPENTPSNP